MKTTVGKLGEMMSAAELADWQLLEFIDPWGDRRADYRAAVICWTIIASQCKNPPPFSKIMKQFDFDNRSEQSDEQLEQMFSLIAGGGKV